MIKIKKSKTADSRTCDFAKVSKETLIASTRQHIEDVRKAMNMFCNMIIDSAIVHDKHKLETIDDFHKAFVNGFEDDTWYKDHVKKSRHHISNQKDVDMDTITMVDVLEYISDCVMAGMARTGKVYDITLPPEVLNQAFKNTVEMLINNVKVED